MSKKKTDFYFFADIDLITKPQNPVGAFGPLSTDLDGNERYRVCSMHSSLYPYVTAYAVCEGKVCAQLIPGSNPKLVNLILKPSSPTGLFPADIGYIIYRGVCYDSLVVTVNQEEYIDYNGLDLPRKINENQTARNLSRSQHTQVYVNDRPTIKALGLDIDDSTVPDTSWLDSIVYPDPAIRNPPGDSEYQMVKPGDRLGLFSGASFGIEFVSEGIGYFPTAESVRVLDHFIKVPLPPISPTDEDILSSWKQKEAIYGYVDAPVIYGMVYGSESLALKARTSLGDFVDVSTQQLYYDAIFPCFANSKLIYVDIRNQVNHAMNFYQNLNDNIQVGYEEGPSATMTLRDYYIELWPLHRIDSSQFPSNSSTGKNVLRIILPAIVGATPWIYIAHGNLNVPAKSIPVETNKKDRFIKNPTIVSGPAEVIEFAVPNLAGGSGTQSIPSLIRIHYHPEIGLTTETLPVDSKYSMIGDRFHDVLFPFSEMRYVFRPDSTHVILKIYEEERVISDNGLFTSAFSTALGIATDIAVGTDPDSFNYTFFALPRRHSSERANKIKPISLVSISKKLQQVDFLSYVAFETGNHMVVKEQLVIDSPSAIYDYLAFESITYSAGSPNHADLAEFIGITVTATEYNSLYSHLNEFSVCDFVFLGLKLEETGKDAGKNAYQKYQIRLHGLVNNSGTLEQSFIETGIYLIYHESH